MATMAATNPNGARLRLMLLLGLALAQTLAAMEMPAELLRAAEMDAELPPGMLDENSMSENNDIEPMEVVHLMPAWLQQQQLRNEPQQQQPQHQQHSAHAHEHQHTSMNMNMNSNSNKNKNKLQQKPLHKQSPMHAATSSLRRCSMEITNTVPGICQPMPPVGSACISGEYVDFLNVECM